MRIFPPVTRDMLRDRWLSAAVTAFAAGVFTLAVALVSFVRVSDVAAAPPAAAVPDAALTFASGGASADLAGAAQRDLFTDDRHAPPKRYRMPGEVEVAPIPVAQRPIVLGTAVGAGGPSFAMLQLADGAVVKARVGNVVAGYTVVTIARTKVTLRTPAGEQIALDASKPVP